MKLHMMNEHVLCKASSKPACKDHGGLLYTEPAMEEHEVAVVPDGCKLNLKPGDIVVCSSEGTDVDVDGVHMKMFSTSSIVGVV